MQSPGQFVEGLFEGAGGQKLLFNTGKKANLVLIFLFSLFFGPKCWGQKLILVEKFSRTLYLYQDTVLFKAFPVSLGFDPISPKRREGDGATPEGLYYVSAKHRSRRYGLFIGLSYPSLKDIALARWEGRLNPKEYQLCLEEIRTNRHGHCPLGYNIGIHGGGVFRKGENGPERDWTHGCIALDDKDVEVVYNFVEPGTPVLIYDAQKPLFEILKHLVPFSSFRAQDGVWHGDWELVTPSLILKLSLIEDLEGRRQLTIIGYESLSERLLFWLNDRNGDGVLEPWEPRQCYGDCLSYQAIKRFILENLPLWVEEQYPRRGG